LILGGLALTGPLSCRKERKPGRRIYLAKKHGRGMIGRGIRKGEALVFMEVLALTLWRPGFGLPVFTDQFKKSAFYFDYPDVLP
jgi:hypothetical protein